LREVGWGVGYEEVAAMLRAYASVADSGGDDGRARRHGFEDLVLDAGA
jgi:hypothetical protein